MGYSKPISKFLGPFPSERLGELETRLRLAKHNDPDLNVIKIEVLSERCEALMDNLIAVGNNMDRTKAAYYAKLQLARDCQSQLYETQSSLVSYDPAVLRLREERTSASREAISHMYAFQTFRPAFDMVVQRLVAAVEEYKSFLDYIQEQHNITLCDSHMPCIVSN